MKFGSGVSPETQDLCSKKQMRVEHEGVGRMKNRTQLDHSMPLLFQNIHLSDMTPLHPLGGEDRGEGGHKRSQSELQLRGRWFFAMLRHKITPHFNSLPSRGENILLEKLIADLQKNS
jgi:hypothetical protein